MKIDSADISREVYGKYTTGFVYGGRDWSDEDESHVFSGRPKIGAIPAPWSANQTPYGYGWWRRLFGKMKKNSDIPLSIRLADWLDAIIDVLVKVAIVASFCALVLVELIIIAGRLRQ